MSDFEYSPEVTAERKERGKVIVQLVGEDGNAFAIMGRVQRALRRAGYSQKAQNEYLAASQSGDYNNLLRVAMEWSDEEDDEATGFEDDEVEQQCSVCGVWDFEANVVRRDGDILCDECASDREWDAHWAKTDEEAS
jgi:hypothetical protein